MSARSSVAILLGALRAPSPYSVLNMLRREGITRAGIIFGVLASRTEPSTSRGQDAVSRDFSNTPSTLFPPNISTDIILLPSLMPFLQECDITPGPKTIWDGILLWAVPKRRTSHSKKRMRMAHKYLKPKHHYQTCQQCGNLKLQHMLCSHCFREVMKRTAEFRKQQGEKAIEELHAATDVVSSSSSSS